MNTPPEFLRRRWYWETHKTARLWAFALLVTCMGCGETKRQVFLGYQSQFAKKRQQFKQIAQLLPPPGTLDGAKTAHLSPKPLYDVKSPSCNTEILMYDEFVDPDIQWQSADRRFDLLLSGDLLHCLQWTGPRNPMMLSVLDERAGNMEETLKKVLRFRYLVVLRPVNIVYPVPLDETTYKRGTADIEAFIVDMERSTVAGSFRFTAHSANQVEYTYTGGQSRNSRREDSELYSLYIDARQKVGSLFRETTGGQFVFEE